MLKGIIIEFCDEVARQQRGPGRQQATPTVGFVSAEPHYYVADEAVGELGQVAGA